MTAAAPQHGLRLLDGLMSGAWAILPETLLEMQHIYSARLRGESIDIAALEAKLGRPLVNEQKAYTVERGGVGVLQAVGVMAPRANLFMQVSGGVSTSMLTRQLTSMQADPSVRSALLVADSPGGSVLALPAAVDAMRALAAAKPTVVVGEGRVASAMYWLASAANALFIEGKTDMAGSIGVVTSLGWDKPQANAVELVRGKYKRASADGQTASPHALEQANAQIDYLYALLVDGVADNRGVSSQTVLDKMADGRVFIGQQAVDAGLVDGFSTVDAMVERLATNPSEFARRRRATFAGGPKASTSDAAPAYMAEAIAAIAPPSPSARDAAADALAKRSAEITAAVASTVSLIPEISGRQPNADAMARLRPAATGADGSGAAPLDPRAGERAVIGARTVARFNHGPTPEQKAAAAGVIALMEGKPSSAASLQTAGAPDPNAAERAVIVARTAARFGTDSTAAQKAKAAEIVALFTRSQGTP